MTTTQTTTLALVATELSLIGAFLLTAGNGAQVLWFVILAGLMSGLLGVLFVQQLQRSEQRCVLQLINTLPAELAHRLSSSASGAYPVHELGFGIANYVTAQQQLLIRHFDTLMGRLEPGGDRVDAALSDLDDLASTIIAIEAEFPETPRHS